MNARYAPPIAQGITTLSGEHPQQPTPPLPYRFEPQSPGGVDDHPPQDILPAADAAAIALELIPMLRRWVAEHKLRCNGELVPLMCLSTAFFAPWLPAARHYLVARVSLWIFMLDDAVDDPHARTDDVCRLLDRCQAVVDGAAADDSDDSLVRSLQDIRRDVDSFAPHPAVRAQWQVCMRELLDGMWFEREIAPATAAGAAPSPEEYLRRARATIGTEAQVVTLWVAIQDPRLPELLPRLLEPLHDAAAAVRLANDLRGWGRTKAQGDADALVLGMPEIEAKAMISRLLGRCRESLRPLTGNSYGPAVALERVALWPIRLYERIDAGRTF